MWPFTMRSWLEPREHYIWAQIRILHETNKVILVTAPHCHARESGHPNNDGMKTWIPKSRIGGIRLRNNTFEIYVREGVVG